MIPLKLVVCLFLTVLPLYGQACTNPGSSGNVCTPVFFTTAKVAKHGDGSAADGSWALINHASDTASGDLGCYHSGQISPALLNLTLAMISSGTFTCGSSNHTQGSQSYLSGAMVWQNLSYQPSEMPSSTVTIEVKALMARGWPAIWLLGGAGNNSGAIGCQYSSINHGWDNIDNCLWDSDGSGSAEVDIAEQTESGGYTVVGHNKFVSGGTSCSQNISSSLTNIHIYHMDWTNSAIHMKVDGTDANCGYTSSIPTHKMFLLIENRVNPSGSPSSFPQTMIIQYVQVCDGSTCTSPGTINGNTVFFDDFGPSLTSSTSPLVLTSHAQTRNIRYGGFLMYEAMPAAIPMPDAIPMSLSLISWGRSKWDYIRAMVMARHTLERRRDILSRWHNRLGRRLIREICAELSPRLRPITSLVELEASVWQSR